MLTTSASTRKNSDKVVTISCVLIFSPPSPILPVPSVGRAVIYALLHEAMCHGFCHGEKLCIVADLVQAFETKSKNDRPCPAPNSQIG